MLEINLLKGHLYWTFGAEWNTYASFAFQTGGLGLNISFSNEKRKQKIWGKTLSLWMQQNTGWEKLIDQIWNWLYYELSRKWKPILSYQDIQATCLWSISKAEKVQSVQLLKKCMNVQKSLNYTNKKGISLQMFKTHFLFVRETCQKRENESSSGCSSLINRPDLTWLMPMSETLLSNFSGNLCCHKKIMCKLLPNTNELESFFYEFPSLLFAIAMVRLQVFRKWA